MAIVATPTANPLSDLIQEPAFLELITSRPSVSMADLPGVLAQFAGHEVFTDRATVDRLIEFTSAVAAEVPDLASTAAFFVVPEVLWRQAEDAVPASDVDMPRGLIWAEAGYFGGQAIVVPNSETRDAAVMLYTRAHSLAAAQLVPARFPLSGEQRPGIVHTECVLDWVSNGEFSRLECVGACSSGTCRAVRYHLRGGPEMAAGCICA